jgi:hypothetical protein
MAKTRLCNVPGCYNTTTGKDAHFCERHAHFGAEQADNPEAAGREKARLGALPKCPYYNTQRWRNLRKEVLDQKPACSRCGSKEELQVHHIMPHRGQEELFFNPRNLVVLCKSCHQLFNRSGRAG